MKIVRADRRSIHGGQEAEMYSLVRGGGGWVGAGPRLQEVRRTDMSSLVSPCGPMARTGVGKFAHFPGTESVTGISPWYDTNGCRRKTVRHMNPSSSADMPHRNATNTLGSARSLRHIIPSGADMFEA